MDNERLAYLVVNAMESMIDIEEINPIVGEIFNSARINRQKAIPYLIDIFNKLNEDGII